MQKYVIAILLLFSSINVSFALSTTIRTTNPVQCNKWGWVRGNIQTVWNNPCTPLEVQSQDGTKVFSISTTENQCNDNQYAIYYFNEGDEAITFGGCYPLTSK